LRGDSEAEKKERHCRKGETEGNERGENKTKEGVEILYIPELVFSISFTTFAFKH
jgi:hypothetical protein